jgi:hypothetical protein
MKAGKIDIITQAWRRNHTVAEANRFSGIPIRTRSGTGCTAGSGNVQNRRPAWFLQLIRPPKLAHGIVALARVSDGFR